MLKIKIVENVDFETALSKIKKKLFYAKHFENRKVLISNLNFKIIKCWNVITLNCGDKILKL